MLLTTEKDNTLRFCQQDGLKLSDLENKVSENTNNFVSHLHSPLATGNAAVMA